MANSNWILAALVGALLIYDAAAISCVKCSTSVSPDTCASGTEAPTVCGSQSDKCYWQVKDGVIHRGCLMDLLEAERTPCTSETDKSCMTCDTADGCNNAKWLKCFKCELNNPECYQAQTEAAGSKFCQGFKAEDSCYTKVAGTEAVRGCLSDLQNPTTECTGKQCDVCKDDSCNKMSGDKLKTYPKCHTCQSSAEPKCVDATTIPVECDKWDDVCYTRVTSNTNLDRGCLSSLNEADKTKCTSATDLSCVTCEGTEEGCNKQNWIQCHQCKQTDAAACADAQTDDKATFCKAFKDANQCYERLENGNMVRGCENDVVTTGNENVCKDNQECRTCDKNACNKENTASLKTKDRCLQCSTSADEDNTCLLGTAATQPCKKASEEKCFSRANTDGVLQRGCKSDLPEAEVTACTGASCAICDKEGCNKGIFPTDRLRCYQCSKTDADKSCSEELTGEKNSAYCKVYKKDDKCYTRIVNNVFERGCESSLKTANACEGLDEKQCKSCTGENCNALSEAKLNSAGRSAISALLLVVVTFVVALR